MPRPPTNETRKTASSGQSQVLDFHETIDVGKTLVSNLNIYQNVVVKTRQKQRCKPRIRQQRAAHPLPESHQRGILPTPACCVILITVSVLCFVLCLFQFRCSPTCRLIFVFVSVSCLFFWLCICPFSFRLSPLPVWHFHFLARTLSRFRFGTSWQKCEKSYTALLRTRQTFCLPSRASPGCTSTRHLMTRGGW